MSRDRDIEKAKKSKIFPQEYIDDYSDDLNLILERQEEELEKTKEEIRSNLDGMDLMSSLYPHL